MNFFVFALLIFSGANLHAALPPNECGRQELVGILKDKAFIDTLLGRATGYIRSVIRNGNKYEITTDPVSGHPSCRIDLHLEYFNSQGQCPAFKVVIDSAACK